MMPPNLRSFLISLAVVCSILAISLVVIAYGRGYRVDVQQKSVSATGLMVAQSDPVGAQLLIDNKLVTATNATVNLLPGWYNVRVIKEGFLPWGKRVRVQGEVVAKADAFLFPANPSLSTLTTSGILGPVASPDGTKLAYIVPENRDATSSPALADRAGIWVLDLVDKPLGLNRDAKQLVRSTTVSWTGATLSWSPDSKQVLAARPTTTGVPQYYLLESDKTTDSPSPVFAIDTLAAQWQDLALLRQKEKLGSLKDDIQPIATASMHIISFSPDETKVLYEATQAATLPIVIKPRLIGTNPTEEIRDLKPGNVYVYDAKEDRNYLLGDSKQFGREPAPAISAGQTPLLLASLSATPPLQWLTTNRHLALAREGKVQIMEYDGTNRQTVYAGPFTPDFLVPWTNTSKLLILTNFNPSSGSYPNLYSINLR